MRLLIKRNDWSTIKYVSDLRRDKYVDWFFKGYEEHPDKDGTMQWNYSLAKRKAGLEGKRKVGVMKNKKKPATKTNTKKKKQSSGSLPTSVKYGPGLIRLHKG
jgi:hypothetical protein